MLRICARYARGFVSVTDVILCALPPRFRSTARACLYSPIPTPRSSACYIVPPYFGHVRSLSLAGCYIPEITNNRRARSRKFFSPPFLPCNTLDIYTRKYTYTHVCVCLAFLVFIDSLSACLLFFQVCRVSYISIYRLSARSRSPAVVVCPPTEYSPTRVSVHLCLCCGGVLRRGKGENEQDREKQQQQQQDKAPGRRILERQGERASAFFSIFRGMSLCRP